MSTTETKEEEIAMATTSPSNAGGRSTSLSEKEIATLSDGHQHCLVCYSDLTTRGKLPCGHDDICGVCHLRLRFLHDDKKCPICKAENDRVIVDADASKQYDDYPQWGDDIGAGFIYKSDVGMFFQHAYYEDEITPLFAFECNKCDFKVDETTKNTSKKNSPQRLLEDHLKTAHRLQMCRLCIDHKRDFVARLPRMTQNQLQTHLKKGDGPASGFSGHPVCEFCRPKRFYDLNYLHQHLHKEHYKCHICEKQGKDNQWFKNYKSLEKHFDKAHFMCHDVQCLQARFVVFENELDLRAHEMQIHGGTSTGSTKINLEFRARRAGYDGSGMNNEQQDAPSDSDFNFDLDGQAFVPEALPNQGSNVNTMANSAVSASGAQLHPLHVQRTEELRAHAAAVRQQQAIEAQGESFPTLQAAAPQAGSAAPLVGWTTGTALQKVNRNGANAGRVTAESFPSLPTSAAAESNAKKKAMKGNLGATRRQFAAMSTSVSQASQPSWGGSSAASVAAAPLSTSAARAAAPSAASFNRQSNLTSDNFPSLGPSAGTRPAPYAAAGALAKKNLQRAAAPPSINSASDFPSMSSTASSSKAKNLKPAPAQPPSLNSAVDFPAPPSASTSTQSNMRQQMLGDSKKPAARMDNVLQVDMTAGTTAKATVEDMKASLGPNKFKQLKRLTKEFAQGQLSSEGYVDQSAALFDRGYADTDFWSYLPSLVKSCPNQDASQQALQYMTSLRQQVYDTESRSTRVTKAPAAASQWGGSGPSNNVMRAAAPAPATRTASTPAGRYVQPPTATSASRLTQPAISQNPNTYASKKKSAWGGSENATVVRAKAPPGSVAGAAAAQGPQTGSATKFMAKQQKKQTSNGNNGSQQSKSNAGGGKKKNKQKNELKALAFGR